MFKVKKILAMICIVSKCNASSINEILTTSLPLLVEDGLVLQDDLITKDLSSASLYFGTGLCTTKEMSSGVPFDYLGLIATAEITRKNLGYGKMIQLIADSHAKTNNFVSDEEVDQQAAEFKELSLKIARNLGFESNFEVILASEVDQSPEYQEIFLNIPAKDKDSGLDIHQYIRKQWADMEYLAQMHNTNFKISWMMPLKKGQKHRSDEAFFDTGFQNQFKRPYSFLYNRSALTFDPNRLNVCPYTSARGEKRILINHAEDAQIKIDEYCASPHKAKDKALAQTAVIVSLLENLSEVTPTDPRIGIRVNNIIRSVLR